MAIEAVWDRVAGRRGAVGYGDGGYAYTFQTPAVSSYGQEYNSYAPAQAQAAVATVEATNINPATGQEWDYNSAEYAEYYAKYMASLQAQGYDASQYDQSASTN
jgi:hypothetical protein